MFCTLFFANKTGLQGIKYSTTDLLAMELQISLPNGNWTASFSPHHAATYAATSNVLVQVDTLNPTASTGTFICLLTHEL